MLIFVTPQFPSDKCDVTATQIADDWLVQFGAEFLNPGENIVRLIAGFLISSNFPMQDKVVRAIQSD
jgi:hypothetical protein